MSKAKKTEAVANTADMKKVVNTLIENFVNEELGNKITKNNMLALSLYITQAIDGQITLGKPE
jgi:hypothetical protein